MPAGRDKSETYAAMIRRGMRAKSMTRRDLERELAKTGKGYSYEHIRKVTSGLPVMSEQFNRDVCGVLALDETLLWHIAAREKLKSNTRTAGLMADAAPDASLRDDWQELLPTDKERIAKIIAGFAEQRRVERVERDTDNPEQIRERILELMRRLGPDTAVTRKRKQQ
jgi:hypothetical protein